MAANPTSDRSELPNLDLLRALAVLLVLADHVLETIGHQTGQSFNPYAFYLGRLGVLLFFVHTSLVLMWSMRRLQLRDWALLKSFYIRRAFRIYPLSILCVLIVVVFGVPILPWQEFAPPSVGMVASNLLLTMNLTESDRVLAPLWSLPIEVQMYLALPLIYLFIGPQASARKAFGLYIIGAIVGSILPLISSRFSVALFAPCFMAGVLAYCLQQRVVAKYPAWWWVVVLIATTVVYIVIEELTPGEHHNLLQWLVCLAVGLMIPLFRQSTLRALNAAAHYIAKYSYGIYLFHCVALWIGCYALDLPMALQWIVVAVVLIAMSVLSFHLLEQPAIRFGAQLARGRARPLPQPA